jgi:hypothetical protein
MRRPQSSSMVSVCLALWSFTQSICVLSAETTAEALLENLATIETNGLRLTISTDKTVYASGEPIFLRVTIKNLEKEYIMIRVLPSLILMEDIVVTYTNRQAVDRTLYSKFLMEPHPTSDAWGSLYPEYDTTTYYQLNRFFDMTLMLDYCVFVRTKVPDRSDRHKSIEVVSPRITVRVEGGLRKPER